MRKGILEYDLDKDEDLFLLAVQSLDLYLFQEEFFETVRQYQKYKELTTEQYEILEELKNKMLKNKTEV